MEPDRPEREEAYASDETGEHRRIDLGSRDRVTSLEALYKERLNEINRGMERFQRKIERSMIQKWVAIIGLYIVACVGGYFLWKTSHRIQSSRVQAALETCQESNDRHDRTIVAFNREFDRAIQRLKEQGNYTPARRAELEQSRAANHRLINVFIPVHKDSAGRSTCPEFARGRVNVDG